MVLYNEHNPDDEAIGSVVKADMRTRPDALIVVGTTLKVPGVKRIVKEMCGIVRDRKDGVTVWINNDPPPALKDYEWDLTVQGPCDHVAAHAAMRRWDQPESEFQLVSDEDVQKVKRENGTPEVVIVSPLKKNKTVDRVQGVITPAPSPKIKPLGTANAAAATAAKGAKATGASKKQATLAGAKRKTDEKPATKKAPAKRAPAKKKDVSKQPVSKMPSGIINFKVSKPTSQPVTVKPGSKAPQHQSLPAQKRADTFAVSPEVVVDVKDKDIKDFLQPLSPSSARTNGSPPYSALPTTPQKSPGYRGIKGSSLTIDTSTPLKETREERQRTVTPPSAPRGLHDLLSWV
jgi:NAD-dependent histone deacetylase SIR2